MLVVKGPARNNEACATQSSFSLLISAFGRLRPNKRSMFLASTHGVRKIKRQRPWVLIFSQFAFHDDVCKKDSDEDDVKIATIKNVRAERYSGKGGTARLFFALHSFSWRLALALLDLCFFVSSCAGHNLLCSSASCCYDLYAVADRPCLIICCSRASLVVAFGKRTICEREQQRRAAAARFTLCERRTPKNSLLPNEIHSLFHSGGPAAAAADPDR